MNTRWFSSLPRVPRPVRPIAGAARIALALATVLASAAAVARADNYYYWRADASAPGDNDPGAGSPSQDPYDPNTNPGGWQHPPGANFTVTIPAYGYAYIACNNRLDPDKKKALTINLSVLAGDPGKIRIDGAAGYDSAGNASSVHFAVKGLRTARIIFRPQPDWEYVRIKNVSGSPQTFTIYPDIETECTDWDRHSGLGMGLGTFDILEGVFGVPGQMFGNPRITRIELFPENVGIDPATPPSFAADPMTGNWLVEPVFADPLGRPRPNGGFRWISDGPGLTVEDPYALGMTMLGEADTAYTMFAWDEDEAEFNEYLLDLQELPWWETADRYEPDTGLHGQGGWEGWGGDPTVDAFVTGQQMRSEPHSLDVREGADVVRTLEGAIDGKWAFATWQYIPGDFTSPPSGDFTGSYFVILNTYPASEDHDWSVQMQFDPRDGMLKVFHGDGTDRIVVPYITDRWTKIEALIDLDHDWTQIYYDDQLVTEYPWTGGVLGGGGGAYNVAAVDLFAQGSSSIYYDDLSLIQVAESCPPDFNGDGTVNSQDFIAFLNAFTSGDPSADFNGDGVINSQDFIAFLNAFVAGC